jgi:hypothetical protein
MITLARRYLQQQALLHIGVTSPIYLSFIADEILQ